MSIKYKIPLIMFIALLLNVIILFGYYKIGLSGKVDLFQKNMNQTVADIGDSIAAEIDGKSFAEVSAYLDDYDNSHGLIFTLINTENGLETTWNPSVENRIGFTHVTPVTISGKTYVFQTQKQIELFSLKTHNVITELLYFEFFVIFIIFLLVGVIIYFRYVAALLKLDAKMRQYKSGKAVAFATVRKDEIGQLEASFAKLSETLREEKKAQNRMIASISHDIKTPLTSILGYSERLTKKDLTPEKQKRYLDIIHSQSKDIEAIVNDFDDYLSATIPETGQVQSYQVSYICKMLEDEYALQLHEKGIAFSVENRCPEATTVYVDLLKIRRLFANVIGNSLRHGKVADLAVSIRTKMENGKAVFVITDNGQGMNEAELSHIFEPFYTSDQSRRVSGLGLSICKQIAEGHGGAIKAYRNEAGGLSLELSLPITTNDS